MKAMQWYEYLKCIECNCKQHGVSKVCDKLIEENPSILSDKEEEDKIQKVVAGSW